MQTTGDPQQSQLLMKKQLPLLSQRLQNTLDKLQAKTDTGRSFNSVQTWWKELQSRYHGRDILFEGEASQEMLIDTDVFDTVLENFLENARSKRRSMPEISISASIHTENNRITIRVCDTGEPVPTSKTSDMFKQILPSNDGYGIGLYQSAQLAEKNGFKLSLLSNKPANVCFQLSNSDI